MHVKNLARQWTTEAYATHWRAMNPLDRQHARHLSNDALPPLSLPSLVSLPPLSLSISQEASLRMSAVR